MFETVFQENSANQRTAQIGLAHLSVELGHLYMDDLVAPDIDLDTYFRRVVPWVGPALLASVARVQETALRVSTCVLVDDYLGTTPTTPDVLVPQLRKAAEENGLRIDYLARESACARNGEVSLAKIVEASLVADPPRDSNGFHPPPHHSGWLCTGERSPGSNTIQAMSGTSDAWQEPHENGSRQHSIFLDVQIWKNKGAERIWSCPFLASVWQLLRLGQLRVEGESAAKPVFLDEANLPKRWDKMPAVTQLERKVAPFAAYRTFSVLDGHYLPVENAVRTILSQVVVDPAVSSQTASRSAAENIPIPSEINQRISYTFLSA